MPLGNLGTQVLGGVLGNMAITPTIGADQLAITMIDWVPKGWGVDESGGEGVPGNAELKSRGAQLLKESKK